MFYLVDLPTDHPHLRYCVLYVEDYSPSSVALTWLCFRYFVSFMYLHLSQSKDKITAPKADLGPLPQCQSKNEEQYREYTAND